MLAWGEEWATGQADGPAAEDRGIEDMVRSNGRADDCLAAAVCESSGMLFKGLIGSSLEACIGQPGGGSIPAVEGGWPAEGALD